MCYACQNPTKATIKYCGKEICADCLKMIYETTPKVLNICFLEDCFEEFA